MRLILRKWAFAVVLTVLAAGFAVGQPATPQNKYKSQEISESDATPVLLMHLPDYEKVAPQAAFARDIAGLKRVLGERPGIDQIDFTAGTEAVTAPYAAGKLLIVEYTTPQASEEADAKFRQAVAGNSSIVYRRIGNYNAFVFDVTDAAAADALLGQVHYEKEIQWVGDPPAKSKKWGVSIPQMASVLLSSFFLLGAGIVIAIGGGAFLGYLYYRRMMRHRAALATFTDAGGITRLNLDGLTQEILPERSLTD